MNCKNCTYWKPSGRKLDPFGRASESGHPVGECHVDSPCPQQAIGGAWRVFPSTIDVDWCGKFQQAEVKSEPEIVVEPKKRGRKAKIDLTA